LLEARLAELGVAPEQAHAELRRALGTGEDHVWDGILVTPRLRVVAELAGRIAGDGPLEPSHLLQAILDEGGGSSAELLARLGAASRRKD
jgi:hypothetical protein